MISKDRKSLQIWAAVLFVLGIAFWAFGLSMAPPPGRGTLDSEELNTADWLKFISGILWLLGTVAYARSKGYSAWYGLLGFFGCIGIFVLYRLPNRWGVVPPTPPEGYGPGDYPRPNG